MTVRVLHCIAIVASSLGSFSVFDLNQSFSWKLPWLTQALPGWLLNLFIQGGLLVVILVGVFKQGFASGHGFSALIEREEIGAKGPGTSTRDFFTHTILASLTGIIVSLIAWASFPVFVLLVLVFEFGFLTVRHWLHFSILGDPLERWKRLHLMSLDRMLTIYSVLVIWFFAMVMSHQILMSMAIEGLTQGRIVAIEVASKYLNLWTSPLPTLRPLPQLENVGLPEQLLVVRELFGTDGPFIFLTAIIFLALIFAIIRLWKLPAAWQLYLKEWYGENAGPYIGRVPPSLVPDPARRVSLQLRFSVVLLYLYAVILSLWSILLGTNLVSYLAVDRGIFSDAFVIPAMWTEVTFSGLGQLGGFMATLLLSAMALVCLLPPIAFLLYRAVVAWSTLRLIRSHALKTTPLYSLANGLCHQAGIRGPLVIVSSARAMTPRSYRFLWWNVIELPPHYVSGFSQGALPQAAMKGILAHEIAHLKLHARRLIAANCLSSVTLVSHNLLTLMLNLTAYEIEADQAAVKLLKHREPVLEGLTFTLLGLGPGQAPVFWGSKGPLRQLVDSLFGHDAIGYVYPTLLQRLAALQSKP
jgi:hypothetical protein